MKNKNNTSTLSKVTLVGFVLCFGIMLLGVITNGGIKTLPRFLSVSSALVTFGGSFLAVLASADSFRDYIDGLKGFTLALKTVPHDDMKSIDTILHLADVARKEGLLALEDKTADMDDEFLKKGIGLVVDGSEPELVRAVLETDMLNSESRYKNVINFWEDLGTMGPAWGMIGTLIGLVNMLQSMGNSSSDIGPSMALALITTLYGSMLANWICAPTVRKLKKNNNKEVQQKEIIIEGVLSIQAGENPRVIQEKLKSFVEEKIRLEISSGLQESA